MRRKIYSLEQYNKALELKNKGVGVIEISNIIEIKNKSVVEGWIYKNRKPLCLLSNSYANNKSVLSRIKIAKKHPGELAYIVGLINGDGHLQIRKDHSSGISFHSKYLSEVEKLNKKFKSLFKVEGKIYHYNKDECYMLFFHSYDLAIFLQSIGVIEGKKTEQEYLVPEWIMNGDNKIKSSFLQGIYSAEGSIPKFQDDNEIRYRIGLHQWKDSTLKENCKNYLNQIKHLVEEFGINCSNVNSDGKSKRKNGKTSYGFKFTFERHYFNKFNKHIGFGNKSKNGRLLKVLKAHGRI